MALNPDFLIAVSTIQAGGSVNNENRIVILEGLLYVLFCDRKVRDGYLRIMMKSSVEHTVDDEVMCRVAQEGLEVFSEEQLRMVICDPFELLCLRDLVMERLRDPDIEVMEGDYWAAALWKVCEEEAASPVA